MSTFVYTHCKLWSYCFFHSLSTQSPHCRPSHLSSFVQAWTLRKHTETISNGVIWPALAQQRVLRYSKPVTHLPSHSLSQHSDTLCLTFIIPTQWHTYPHLHYPNTVTHLPSPSQSQHSDTLTLTFTIPTQWHTYPHLHYPKTVTPFASPSLFQHSDTLTLTFTIPTQWHTYPHFHYPNTVTPLASPSLS